MHQLLRKTSKVCLLLLDGASDASVFYPPHLRGKTVAYEIEVSEVRERKLPEIDEDFLKGFNAESVEDLKAQIMDDLENRKKQEGQEAQRNQILDYLAEQVDIPLPESAVEAETQSAVSRMVSQNMQMGTTEEELEKHRDEIFS